MSDLHDEQTDDDGKLFKITQHLDVRGLTFTHLDNRGCGRSAKPKGPYSTRQLAEDALQVLNAADVQVAHVAGLSLGGMIAQELALGHADRVDRLALLCTTAGGADAYPMPAQTVQLFVEAPTLAPEPDFFAPEVSIPARAVRLVSEPVGEAPAAQPYLPSILE